MKIKNWKKSNKNFITVCILCELVKQNYSNMSQLDSNAYKRLIPSGYTMPIEKLLFLLKPF